MPGMKDFPIPAGTRFGNLVVLGPAPKKGRHARFFVKCDCRSNVVFTARGALLRDDTTTRCKQCAAKAAVETRRLKGQTTVDPLIAIPMTVSKEDRLTILDQLEATVRLESQQERELNETREKKKLARKLLAG